MTEHDDAPPIIAVRIWRQDTKRAPYDEKVEVFRWRFVEGVYEEMGIALLIDGYHLYERCFLNIYTPHTEEWSYPENPHIKYTVEITRSTDRPAPEEKLAKLEAEREALVHDLFDVPTTTPQQRELVPPYQVRGH